MPETKIKINILLFLFYVAVAAFNYIDILHIRKSPMHINDSTYEFETNYYFTILFIIIFIIFMCFV